MKIICSKNILLENISMALKATISKSTLEILEYILLTANKEEFKMLGNNLCLGIETKPIPAEIVNQGSVAISGKFFNEVVRKLPEGNVTIETNKDNIIKISCEKSKFNLRGESGTYFPSLPKVEKDKYININSKDFKEMVNQTIFSVSTNEAKLLLTGELLEIEDSKITMVAIDGFRVAIKSINLDTTNINNEKIVIPAKSLNEITKIIGNDEEISIFVTDKNILFDCEKCTFVSRLLEGEYMHYLKLFTEEYSTKIFVNRSRLIESLERASIIITDIKKDLVKFSIQDKTLKIESVSSKQNGFDEEIDIEIEGNDMEIAFNPKYILDILKATCDEEITMQFNNSLNPCIIYSSENDSYKFLVLPLRI